MTDELGRRYDVIVPRPAWLAPGDPIPIYYRIDAVRETYEHELRQDLELRAVPRETIDEVIAGVWAEWLEDRRIVFVHVPKKAIALLGRDPVFYDPGVPPV